MLCKQIITVFHWTIWYQLISMICCVLYILFSIGNAFLGFVSLTNCINFVAVIVYEFSTCTVSPVRCVQLNWKYPNFVCVFGMNTKWAVDCVVTPHNGIGSVTDILILTVLLICCLSKTVFMTDSRLLYLHLVRKYIRPNRSCSFCQPWGFVLCCRIIPPANSAYRDEGVTKVIINFRRTRKWTHQLSQQFRVRPEENFEHLSHDMRSKVESDISVYATVQHYCSLSYLERGVRSVHTFSLMSILISSPHVRFLKWHVSLWVTSVTHHFDVLTFLDQCCTVADRTAIASAVLNAVTNAAEP